MGIRLYKKLGWALSDLEYNRQTGALTDPRVNASALTHRPDGVGPQYLEYLKALRDAEHENSDEWFELSMTIAMVEAAQEKEKTLPWPVTRESEAGLRGTLLIQPVGYSHWTRYGDAIDQNEENALYLGEYFRTVPLPYGIYPFEGLYMDSRDGRRLDSTAKRMIDRLIDAMDEDGPKNEMRLKAADHLARNLGFEDSEQARQHIAPIVPSDVLHVISWLNLFNGPDVWLQLRPVLYVYWA